MLFFISYNYNYILHVLLSTIKLFSIKMGDGYMKKARIIVFLIISFTLIVSGCSFPITKEEQNNSLESTSIIAPSVKLNEQYYRGVLPYKQSRINGMLQDIPYKLDSKYFELGLLELAKSVYDPSNYIFQEGQILTMNDIEPLLNSDNYPQYDNFVYTVAEHDYLYENGEYGGVMIGLLVSPKYYLRDENGDYLRNENGARMYDYYTDEELQDKSKQLAADVASLVRRKVPDTSVTVGVMKAELKDPKLPGTFFLLGESNQENSGFTWKEIDEYYLFLPAELKMEDKNSDIVNIFNYFKGEMDDYLPGFAGITGLARIVNGELVEITIKSLAEFDSTTQIIQYTQFGISRINKYFPENTHVNFYVNTIDKPKALYIRKSNGEDFMHIYRE